MKNPQTLNNIKFKPKTNYQSGYAISIQFSYLLRAFYVSGINRIVIMN